MTNNELIKELVTYDGYIYKETVTDGYFVIDNYENEGKEFIFTFIDLEDYLTDMNILHRIAVKVVREVVDSELDVSDINDLCFNIRNAIMYSPNEQGEHLQLAEAIVNAIRYISENKAG